MQDPTKRRVVSVLRGDPKVNWTQQQLAELVDESVYHVHRYVRKEWDAGGPPKPETGRQRTEFKRMRREAGMVDFATESSLQAFRARWGIPSEPAPAAAPAEVPAPAEPAAQSQSLERRAERYWPTPATEVVAVPDEYQVCVRYLGEELPVPEEEEREAMRRWVARERLDLIARFEYRERRGIPQFDEFMPYTSTEAPAPREGRPATIIRRWREDCRRTAETLAGWVMDAQRHNLYPWAYSLQALVAECVWLTPIRSPALPGWCRVHPGTPPLSPEALATLPWGRESLDLVEALAQEMPELMLERMRPHGLPPVLDLRQEARLF